MLHKGGGIPVKSFVLIVGILLMSGVMGGCSKGPPQAIQVAGTVTTSDGAPVSGVRLILTPDSGNILSQAEFTLDQEGHFEGQALPGSYGFYFVPVEVEREDSGKPANKTEAKKLEESNQSLNKLVPAGYRSPTGDGAKSAVQVTAGTEIALVLAK